MLFLNLKKCDYICLNTHFLCLFFLSSDIGLSFHASRTRCARLARRGIRGLFVLVAIVVVVCIDSARDRAARARVGGHRRAAAATRGVRGATDAASGARARRRGCQARVVGCEAIIGLTIAKIS